MKYKIKSHIVYKDLIPNIKETYPQIALDMKINNTFDEEMLHTYLYQNKFCLVGYHCTRLTDFEINEIKAVGFSLGGKELLCKKVKKLPKECDDIKNELLDYIGNLSYTQADSSIYFSFGKLNFDVDKGYDKIFTQNWGGETIYNYYDRHYKDKTEKEHMKYVKEKLQAVSKPCIILLRCPFGIGDVREYTYFYDGLKNEAIENIFGSMCIKNYIPKVIDVIDLNKYSGIDFS